MTEMLSAGYTHTLTQNVVYALPAKVVFLRSSAALEVSVDNSTWVLLASSTTGTQAVSPYVRCTTGTAILALKEY